MLLKIKMTENQAIIESKFESRNNAFFLNETFSEFKEESMNRELSLGKSIRERLFFRKRKEQKLRKGIPKSSSPSKIENYLTISKELYEKCKESEVNINQLNQIISYFKSDNLEKKYMGLIGIRKLLVKNNPPVEIILNYNLLPGIVSLLDGGYSEEFIHEALWCLINISCENKQESERIKNQGGIEKIISLIYHNMDKIKEMALWCLENLSCGSLEIKKFLVKKKIINILMTVLSTNDSEKIISHCVCVIKNLISLYSKKKKANLDKDNLDIKKLIDTISNLMINHEYIPENECIQYIYYDSCYILSFLAESFSKCRDILLENGVIQFIIKLMQIPIIERSERFFHILLKIIGNIICGNENQTKQILNDDVFAILKKHITNESNIIQNEVCWIISNISADTDENRIKIIDSGLFHLLLQVLEKCNESIRIEVVYSLCDLTLINDEKYLGNLIGSGLLKVICDCIKGKYSKEIAICLEALDNLLFFGERHKNNGYNVIRYEIERLGLCDVLEKLQYDRNEYIYERACNIIEKYFEYDHL